MTRDHLAIPRRDILLGGAAGLTLASAALSAPRPAPSTMMGVLGSAGRGPGRPVIAMLAHPKMILQDFVGPLTVFNLMRAEIHFVWRSLTPVMTEVGVPIMPTTIFADCPADLDVLFVPGGFAGSIDMMKDAEVLAFLADRGARAQFVTSDCTGSLVLGAAGLLRGYKATSHWQSRDVLALMGAIPTNERVVRDRNRLTGGGVTAGIDFGLTLCALIKGEELAKRIQLTIEYAPAPPFDAGTPETAPPKIVESLNAARRPLVEAARVAAMGAATRFR